MESKIQRRKRQLEALRGALASVIGDDPGAVIEIKPTDLNAIRAALSEISSLEDEIEILRGDQDRVERAAKNAALESQRMQAEIARLRALLDVAGIQHAD